MRLCSARDTPWQGTFAVVGGILVVVVVLYCLIGLSLCLSFG
jgi:hypothetical protein